MLRSKISAILLTLTLSSSAYAQSISELPVISTEGTWELRKAVDSFTDEVNCVIVLRSNPEVQANNNTLYVGGGRGNGGLAGYRLRFDDNPPGELQLADRIEKEIDSIILEGRELDAVRNSQRLRVQAVGILSGTGFQHDIDLDSLNPMIREWQINSCQ